MNAIRERLTALSASGPRMRIGPWVIGGPTWAMDGSPIG